MTLTLAPDTTLSLVSRALPTILPYVVCAGDGQTATSVSQNRPPTAAKPLVLISPPLSFPVGNQIETDGLNVFFHRLDALSDGGPADPKFRSDGNLAPGCKLLSRISVPLLSVQRRGCCQGFF